MTAAGAEMRYCRHWPGPAGDAAALAARLGVSRQVVVGDGAAAGGGLAH